MRGGRRRPSAAAALPCPVPNAKYDLLRRSHKFCEVDVRALPDRWIVAIGGSAVMLLIGTVYSWAIFAQPLVVDFGWDLTTTTWAYAIANFSLATVGGRRWILVGRKGPRSVAMTGVALRGAGNVLAGLGTPVFGAPWLYLTYDLMGGIGAGMAYITPLAVVTKWFPERRGLAGGLVVGSFGLGAFIYNQFIPRLPAFHSFSVAGGIPLKRAGKVVGAVGVSGGSGEQVRRSLKQAPLPSVEDGACHAEANIGLDVPGSPLATCSVVWDFAANP